MASLSIGFSRDKFLNKCWDVGPDPHLFDPHLFMFRELVYNEMG